MSDLLKSCEIVSKAGWMGLVDLKLADEARKLAKAVPELLKEIEELKNAAKNKRT